MELSASQLEEITGCIPTSTAGPHERRKAVRIPLPVRTAMLRVHGNVGPRPVFVRVRDISASGIGLVHTQPMQIGEEFVVAIPRKEADSLCIRCAVVRCQSAEGGIYIIGASFSSIVEARHAGAAAGQASAATSHT